MKNGTHKVLVIPGDGIGKEITDEAVKVLNAVAEVNGYRFEYDYADLGGAAYDKAVAKMTHKEIERIDSWDDEKKTELTLPKVTIDKMDKVRGVGGSILFGSVGRADLPKRTAELALLAMRKRYGVVNNRPFIIDPILAHNSTLFRRSVKINGFEIISPEESLFNGEHKEGADFSYTRKRFTKSKVESIVKNSFEKAKKEGKKILCVTKYNVLMSEKFLSDTFEKYKEEYEGQVELNEWSQDGQLIIDNAGMQIAANPDRYRDTVVICDAMFGDFLQAIVDVVSGSKAVNKPALEKIKQEGIYRTFIRELCGGLYFGERKDTKEFVYDTCEYDRKTIQNIGVVAKKVNDQAGLPTVDSMEIDGVPTCEFWAKEVDKNAKENGYKVRHLNIKEGVETLLTDPASLGTVITSNMIGDIYTDLAAAVVGKSLGLMPSSAVNAEGFGIYEQIAGTAPGKAGKNTANPIGEIRSAAMMLEDIGDAKGAKIVNDAISKSFETVRTGDIMEEGFREVLTSELGDVLVDLIQEHANVKKNAVR